MNGMPARSAMLRDLAPLVGQMREHVLLQSSLESLPADRLRAARELATLHLLQECGYCLDERNRSDSVHAWSIDFMREVALADEVLDRIDSGKYVARVTNIEFKEPPRPAIRPTSMAAVSTADSMNEEEADALV